MTGPNAAAGTVEDKWHSRIPIDFLAKRWESAESDRMIIIRMIMIVIRMIIMITTRIDVGIWDNSIKHKISFTVTKKKRSIITRCRCRKEE
jgi:hypothetical protein